MASAPTQKAEGAVREAVDQISGWWESRFAKAKGNLASEDWIIGASDVVEPIVEAIVQPRSEPGSKGTQQVHSNASPMPFAERKDCNILIVGCGTSGLVALLYDAGFHSIVCTDVCPSAIAIQERLHGGSSRPGIRFEVADATALTSRYPRGSFDVVVDKSATDSVLFRSSRKAGAEAASRMLSQIAAVLKPDTGRFIMVSASKRRTRIIDSVRIDPPPEDSKSDSRKRKRAIERAPEQRADGPALVQRSGAGGVVWGVVRVEKLQSRALRCMPKSKCSDKKTTRGGCGQQQKETGKESERSERTSSRVVDGTEQRVFLYVCHMGQDTRNYDPQFKTNVELRQNARRILSDPRRLKSPHQIPEKYTPIAVAKRIALASDAGAQEVWVKGRCARVHRTGGNLNML